MIADTGFCSEKNILACEEAHLEPLIAVARDVHHPGWRERHSEPALLRDNATPMQSMAHRLESKAGRALYALRKTNGRTRIRHHQVGDGLSPVLCRSLKK